MSQIGTVPLIHCAVMYTNGVLACTFNILLLYLIRTTNTKIGSYSRLLSLMAIFNISYAVIHVLNAPYALVDAHSVAFVPTGIFESNLNIGYFLNLAYCSFFAQSLVLLMYHFLYRYIAVCRYQQMAKMHRPEIICLCIAVYISVPVIWTGVDVSALVDDKTKVLMTDVLLRKLGINSTTSGMLAFSFMYPTASGSEIHLPPWIGAAIFCLIMAIFFSVMTFCAIRIFRKLREPHASTSQNYHQLQIQLLRALIVQTAVPFTLEYCACGMMFFAPITGLPIPLDYTTLCISAYPMVEPLVVIFFVRDYRTALLKKLHLWKPVVLVASSISPISYLQSVSNNVHT